MKRLLSIILMMLLLASCAQAEGYADNPHTLSGYWLDGWSGRANLTITYAGGEHRAVVRWANSAFETIHWEMTGRFVEGVLQAEDCTKYSLFFSEDGTPEKVVHYENEDASLSLTDGVITWTDPEKMGAECRFEMYTELDLRDVFNPEHHAHLYVLSIHPAANGAVLVEGALGTVHENGQPEGFDRSRALTLPLAPDADIRLPEASSEQPAVPADAAAWFSARAFQENAGFYALLALNESGEITRLLCNEDQPAAPAIPEETAPVMIVPAPPSGR